MATVKLEYIFIEKEKHESKTVKMLIEEIMKKRFWSVGQWYYQIW